MRSVSVCSSWTFPSIHFPPGFWVCQIILPVRAKPDGLIAGIGMLPSRESANTRRGGRGCLLRGFLQPPEMKPWEAGLDSAGVKSRKLS